MKKLLILLLLSLGFMGTTSAGEVETNILKLNALNSCEGCNLQGANLSGIDCFRANLKNANLTGANLKNADLTGAMLCNTETPWGVDDSGC